MSTDTTPPRAFISYSHEDEETRSWVFRLGNELRERGVDVILDQFDTRLGSDLPAFMSRGLRESHRVLLICSEDYVRKADGGQGGVGYEARIVARELLKDGRSEKFIPVLWRNPKRDIPDCVAGRKAIDFNDDSLYEGKVSELVRELHNIPRKRPLGPAPVGSKALPLDEFDNPSVVKSLRELRGRTKYLWELIVHLDAGGQGGVTDIMLSTFERVRPALDQLRAGGHLRYDTSESYRTFAKNEQVLEIALRDVTLQMVNVAKLIEQLSPPRVFEPPPWDRPYHDGP